MGMVLSEGLFLREPPRTALDAPRIAGGSDRKHSRTESLVMIIRAFLFMDTRTTTTTSFEYEFILLPSRNGSETTISSRIGVREIAPSTSRLPSGIF
ncbi:hypothetical protein TNCV_4636091 [Trichonephila clavipes]|nr:hypothetical protein TNCV_4636091 [Trichonephila clavipes]